MNQLRDQLAGLSSAVDRARGELRELEDQIAAPAQPIGAHFGGLACVGFAACSLIASAMPSLHNGLLTVAKNLVAFGSCAASARAVDEHTALCLVMVATLRNTASRRARSAAGTWVFSS